MPTSETIETRKPFVDHFLATPADAPQSLEPTYDEGLRYNVIDGGLPYVAVTAAGGTRTMSEIEAERDDSDEDVRTRTTTFVEAEADDFAACAALRTETAIKAERPDFDEWA